MSLRKNRFKPYALIIPATLFILFIVCTGLGVGLLQSLEVFRTIGMTRLTTEYYKSVFSSHNFLQSLYFSLYTSLCASVIAVLIGVALSVIFLNLKQRGKKAARIFRIPVSVPHLIGATVPKALPVQAFIEYTNPLLENRPYAMAYSMLNLIFCLSLLLLFYAMYKILFRKVNIK